MNVLFHDEDGNIINYYDVLNIPSDAAKEDIRSSFYRLIKHYHPDISGENTVEGRKKADLIIKGYKILIDDATRGEYDRVLFSGKHFSPSGYRIIPKKRVKYSMSLSELLKTRMLNKKIRHRERIYKFGQDIEIFITPGESRSGFAACIDLPSRIACPVCYGEQPECHLCHGVGRITSTTMLEITVPPPVEHGRIVEIDLLKSRPDRFTSFTMKTLRIKISIIGKTSGASA